MKLILLCFSVVFFLAQGHAQPNSSTQSAKQNTYAVIIGISKYASKGIPRLKFSNKDAIAFDTYLKSNAGGNVPEENIRLLLDSNASTAAIYEAIFWVMETCQENDLVYFYFSGHGDMESETIYKLGFLLTYNTPRTNYINNALRIEDLNNFANTLSSEKKSKVVIITDACHSGQLAGSGFRGNYLVGDQLRTVKKKEIRITSCATNQLSVEDEYWGGGRGVFSYYLINGLTGFAETKKDGFVTLGEIRTYLDSALAKDVKLKEIKHVQNPVLAGTDQFRIASVDSLQMVSMVQPKIIVGTSGNLNEEPPPVFQPEIYINEVFSRMSLSYPERFIDFEKLKGLPVSKIPFSVLDDYKIKILKDSLKYDWEQLKKAHDEVAAVNAFENALASNEKLVKDFNKKLVILIHDRAQEVINLFLTGDAAELERRRYYNAENNGYAIYGSMMDVALKLNDPKDYLNHILQLNKYYFSALVVYLKIPLTDKPGPLIEEALVIANKALLLDSNAAYIYNQLGALYLMKNEFSKAEKHFYKAIELSPQWALPWSNLLALYNQTNKPVKAAEAFEKAKKIQPDLQNTYVNAGVLYENEHNLLYAEEMYRKSIQINSRHYLPFERMGYVLMHTTSYAQADSFFYEADIRKRGYHFVKPLSILVAASIVESNDKKMECFFDTTQLNKLDVMGYFAWGILSYDKNNLKGAEDKFRKVIAMDSSNPLAFHYLGKILYEQQRWKEADIILNYAVKYHLNYASFKKYCDSVSVKAASYPFHSCTRREFEFAYYAEEFNHYFLASMYQQWNHYTEAEMHYRKLIALTPEFIGPYHELWNMLEKIGRYQDAETVLYSFATIKKHDADNELNAFYKRMSERLPGDGYWAYKAGIFLYRKVEGSTTLYKKDLKTILPDDTLATVVFEPMKYPEYQADYVTLPGIKTGFIPANEIRTPYSDGILYLLKADTLLASDDYATADINDKIGDLYQWQGLSVMAAPHYQKAVDFQPENSGVRLKLIDTYDATWQYTNAKIQLDSLKNKREINFVKQLLLAKYTMHMGSYKEAEDLLKEARLIHPYVVPEIENLSGRLYLLSGNAKQSISFFTLYLQLDPHNAEVMYCIARLYAKNGNQQQAWKWLDQSIANGFKYRYVLELDDYWNAYRQKAEWKKKMEQTNFKTYPEPLNALK